MLFSFIMCKCCHAIPDQLKKFETEKPLGWKHALFKMKLLLKPMLDLRNFSNYFVFMPSLKISFLKRS